MFVNDDCDGVIRRDMFCIYKCGLPFHKKANREKINKVPLQKCLSPCISISSLFGRINYVLAMVNHLI